jgi:aquaporin Z
VLIEAGMTATLVLTIFAFVSSRRTARWTPVAVWLLVAGFVWQVAPLTTSLNPARTLGPPAVSGNFSVIWVYVVGPWPAPRLRPGDGIA